MMHGGGRSLDDIRMVQSDKAMQEIYLVDFLH